MKNFTKLLLLSFILCFQYGYAQKDTIPPVIDLNTTDTICVKLGTVYLAVQPTVSDNVSSENMISLRLVSTNVNVMIPGLYKQVYEAVDAAGNKITKTRYIIVDENCPSATNINENLIQSVSIYPNPANTSFQVYIPDLNETAQLSIYAMDGKLIVLHDLSNSFNQINIENLNEGIYWIHITQNNSSFSQKLIVRR
jgi:hypothetical protein